MSRSSRRWLTLAIVVSSGLCSGAACEPRNGQAPGEPGKAAKETTTAAKKVEVSIHILTELNILQLVIETDPLVRWTKPLIGAMETRFHDETQRRTVVIQVTLHPDRPADLEVAGKPAPTDAEVKDLLRAADAKAAPRTRLVDCSFRLVAKINGGHPDEKLALSPRLDTPDERRFAEFQAAATPKKLDMIRRWARTEALPLLAAAATTADAQFQGVRDLGRAITRLDPKAPADVAGLTDRNPNYWRAMLEMTPGNPLVSTIRVALHAANGEIDQARRYADVAMYFDANESGPSRLLGEARAMMRLFDQDVHARIRKGIALHDKEQFAEAMAVYDGVLKDDPSSAWAHYERFHTRMAMAMKEKKPLDQVMAGWPEARAAILAGDPLYQMMAEAHGQEETYRLVLRLEINSLFKERDKTARDLLRYADIARDLDVYGFAGMLYWNILTAVKPEDYAGREPLEDFLYCLEQLGVKTIKENFRGDHVAAFARIKAERKKRVENGLGADAQPKGTVTKPEVEKR